MSLHVQGGRLCSSETLASYNTLERIASHVKSRDEEQA